MREREITDLLKVKTAASEFRAFVQELTGRDSGIPDLTKYQEINGCDKIEEINGCDKIMQC